MNQQLRHLEMQLEIERDRNAQLLDRVLHGHTIHITDNRDAWRRKYEGQKK